MNISSVTISFTVYSNLAVYNMALVVCILILYISSLCVNLLLVLVISMTTRLHRPMYLLLVNLALNGVVGSSAVCPEVLRQLLATRHESLLVGCLTHVFFINMYSSCVFCTLALMAFDRYVSICRPLRYHAIMSLTRVKLMLLLMYVFLGSCSAIQVYLTSRLHLCSFTVEKLWCDSLAISKISCKKSLVIYLFGLCVSTCVILLPCMLVILSYVHIFMVVIKTLPESRQKALQTCLPHLITFVNFSLASFFGLIYNRVYQRVPLLANVLVSINFIMLPPLLHPVVYGIKTQEIRQSLSRMLRLWTA